MRAILLLGALAGSVVVVSAVTAARVAPRSSETAGQAANEICVSYLASVQVHQLPSDLGDALGGISRNTLKLRRAGDWLAHYDLPEFSTAQRRLAALGNATPGDSAYVRFLAYRRAFLAAFTYEVNSAQTGDYALAGLREPILSKTRARLNAAAKAIGAPACHV